MTDATPKNKSASVRARLLHQARFTHQDFQVLVIRYVVERFLVRLCASPHSSEFVLKGAMLFWVWKLDDARTTMDLDLLRMGDLDLTDLVGIFGTISRTDIEDDGLRFDSDSIQVNPIREDAYYGGARVRMSAHLGAMEIRLNIDVGVGDAVTPSAELVEFPALLETRGPRIRAYPRETVIAEKFHAMVLLGMANSRMKDYGDLWLLLNSFSFDATLLQRAIESTFTARRTPVPTSIPSGLHDDFGHDAQKQAQWRGFIARQRQRSLPRELIDVVSEVRAFLSPIVVGFADEGSDSWGWSPNAGWEVL